MAKPKKKTPKQIIKELETTLQHVQAEKQAREVEATDTNIRLAHTIDTLKGLVLTQQKERDVSHDATEKELRLELGAAKAELVILRETTAKLKGDAEAIATLQKERLVLLRHVAEAVASRENEEKRHAAETHELNMRINNLKKRLETIFNDTLREAIADEKKRLASELDIEASTAMKEVAQLRIASSENTRQIAQLSRISDDRAKDANMARKEQERATEELVAISKKHAQQTTYYTEKLLLADRELMSVKMECKRLNAVVTSATHRVRVLLIENAHFRTSLGLPASTAAEMEDKVLQATSASASPHDVPNSQQHLIPGASGSPSSTRMATNYLRPSSAPTNRANINNNNNSNNVSTSRSPGSYYSFAPEAVLSSSSEKHILDDHAQEGGSNARISAAGRNEVGIFPSSSSPSSSSSPPLASNTSRNLSPGFVPQYDNPLTTTSITNIQIRTPMATRPGSASLRPTSASTTTATNKAGGAISPMQRPSSASIITTMTAPAASRLDGKGNKVTHEEVVERSNDPFFGDTLEGREQIRVAARASKSIPVGNNGFSSSTIKTSSSPIRPSTASARPNHSSLPSLHQAYSPMVVMNTTTSNGSSGSLSASRGPALLSSPVIQIGMRPGSASMIRSPSSKV